MKKLFLTISAISLLTLNSALFAAPQDLLDVFQQALQSDPTFKAQIAQIQSTKEGVPIARSYLLPQLTTQLNVNRNWLDNRAGVVINTATDATYGQGNFTYNYGQYQINLNQ